MHNMVGLSLVSVGVFADVYNTICQTAESDNESVFFFLLL